MTLLGSPDRFALGFELRDYPDRSGRPEARASWGALTIWVGGRNLTAGRLGTGESVDHALVPLLPVARWLLNNWDYLLHEERLPRPASVSSSAAWSSAVLRRLPEDEPSLNRLLDERETWCRRHGLGAWLPDYRVPDLNLRRSADKIEISWDDVEWRQVPRGVLLVEHPGAVQLPVAEVARTIRAWCTEAATAFASKPALATATSELLAGLAGLDSPSRTLVRAEIAVGAQLRRLAISLRTMAGVVGGSVDDTVRTLLDLSQATVSEGAITSLPVPALLFRSASPNLSVGDLTRILSFSSDGASRSTKLDAFRSPSFPGGDPDAITQDGYDLAMEFRERAGLGAHTPLAGNLDLEHLLTERFGVTVRDVHLDEVYVDGVAVVTPGRDPLIAVNRSGRFARSTTGRRMTLAHELCHVLHDMTENGIVGVVSGPWAPYVLERRANAFAAMLLAPEAAIESVLPRDSETWTAGGLRDAMRALGIGISTLTWHLYNLRWISESERQAWVDELFT